MEEENLATAPESAPTSSLSLLGSRATHEFIRYVAASACALVVDTSLLYLLTRVLNIPYLWSGVIAFSAGVIVIYVLSVWWVFEKRSLLDWRTEFLIFLSIGVVGLALNELVLWILVGAFALPLLGAKLGSVVVVFTWNFAARKTLLFRKTKHR